MARAVTPESAQFPTRHYDIVKEFVIATVVVVLLTVALAALFSSPDEKSLTVKGWANSNGPDFVTTAVAELDGPAVALAAVDRLDDTLAGYHAYHATRADLLRRLGCSQQSRAAYDQAIALAGNVAETAYLTRRRDQLA